MHKTLVLGVLLVVALSGPAISGSDRRTAPSETETMSVGATPEATLAAPRVSQLETALSATDTMVAAAHEMVQQQRVSWKLLTALYQNPAVMQNPSLKAKVYRVRDSTPDVGKFLEHNEDLRNAVRQALQASR